MKSMKKRVIKAFLFLFCTGAIFISGSLILLFICNRIVRNTEYTVFYHEGLKDMETYDYLIVPGAGIVFDQPGVHLLDRLNTAITLYEQGVSENILISGAPDETSPYSETDVMFMYLIDHGIPAEHILLDEYGYSTWETLHRAKEHIGDSTAIICTQEMYMPRTMYFTQKLGMDAVAVSSDIHIYTEGVLKAQLREYLACVKAVLTSSLFPNSPHTTQQFPLIQGGSLLENLQN